MKKVLALILVLSFAIICLSSCKASFKGEWVFDENGAVFNFGNGGKLSVTLTLLGETYDLGEGEYTEGKGELTITNFVYPDFDKIADETVRANASAFIKGFIAKFGSCTYVIEKNVMTLTASDGSTAVFEKK